MFTVALPGSKLATAVPISTMEKVLFFITILLKKSTCSIKFALIVFAASKNYRVSIRTGMLKNKRFKRGIEITEKSQETRRKQWVVMQTTNPYLIQLSESK